MKQYFLSRMLEDDVKRIKEIGTINELEDFCLTNYADLVAIKGFEYTKTYRELFDDISYTRASFIKLGIKEGDHIAIMLKNEYDFMRYFLAITTYGCCAVLIPMQAPLGNLKNICLKMDVKYLIYSKDLEEGIKGLDINIKAFNQSCFKNEEKHIYNKNNQKQTKATVIFTGGTTGNPKGVLLSHGNLCRGMINGVEGIYDTFFQSYFAFVPFTHVFGLIRNGLTALYTGSQLYMCEDMKQLFRDLAIAKPTILVLVPALAEMIWGVIVTRGIDAVGGKLRIIICGGAHVNQKTIDKLSKFNIEVFPGYGLTETSNLVCGNAYPLKKPNCVGQPYEHQEFMIVDNELLIKGDNIMLGYYNDAEANAKNFVDGWLKTGDLVRFDEDNDIYIIGRSKNVIVLDNGENVSPEELEQLINAIPLVSDTLVYEDKNDIGTSVITAEIFPNKNAVEKLQITNVEEALQKEVDYINSQLPTFMRIAKIIVCEKDFERSPSMKIIRKGPLK